MLELRYTITMGYWYLKRTSAFLQSRRCSKVEGGSYVLMNGLIWPLNTTSLEAYQIHSPVLCYILDNHHHYPLRAPGSRGGPWKTHHIVANPNTTIHLVGDIGFYQYLHIVTGHCSFFRTVMRRIFFYTVGRVCRSGIR